MRIEDYFGEWFKVIDHTELYNIINTINKMYKTKSICPKQIDVFKAFHLCDYNELKVIMIAQDPYPQRGIATGLAFGNALTTEESNYSPSLEVIKDSVMELHYPGDNYVFDPSLESWAKQGVLLLNSALTVETNKVGSHIMIWRPFISKFLKNLGEISPGLIYVLFGNQAKTFKPYIGKNNDIIECMHPSYYARYNKRMNSNIFTNINTLLKNKNNTKILF